MLKAQARGRLEERRAPRVRRRGATVRISLRDKAYTAIKGAILDGELVPGDVISESERAKVLGVSRTPVREALQSLAQEGFVEIMPKRGTLVARTSVRDVRECFELRIAVESTCARLAAERATEEEVEAMRSAQERVVARRGDYESGAGLHALIVAAADNHYLAEAFASTADRIRLASRVAARTLRLHHDPSATHEAIVDAIARRDPAAAERAMRRHLEAQARALIAALL